MRHLDTRLAGKAGLALTVALLLTLALVAVGSAQPPAPPAPQIPARPHQFFGNVKTDQGKLLPAGTVVTATLAYPGYTYTATSKVDALGRYGYPPPSTNLLYVVGEDNAVSSAGKPVAFNVLGVQVATYPFNYGGHTELNLSVPISYTITATAGPNGKITPSGAVKVAYGFDKAFTITPNSNYLRLDVKVDGASNPGAVASGVYTFTNVTANHTIAASFLPATFVITPTAGTGCTITPSTPQTVAANGSQTFTIAANTGYALTDVKVDGVSNPGAVASGTYTFSNVQDDHTIAAICMPRTSRVYLPIIFR